jgi:tripartite-type tricarboxylate transporter receptor subunit TctC
VIKRFCLLTFAILGTVISAAAQDYPNRPIRLIVPFAPGGPPDVIARVIGEHLGPRLKTTIVIDNRPGAGATIGSRAAAAADPDGYTLMFASTTALSIAPYIMKDVGYDPLTAFAPVGGISIGPMVVCVHPSLPVNSVKELVAYAKANPGKLNYGSGVASPPHIAWGLFTTVTDTKIQYVPYRGMAAAMNDLVAGQIQMMIDGVGPLLPFIQDGKVKPLAVTGKTRSSDFPNLPTMIEAGYPEYVLSFWTGMVAPAATPPALIAKVNDALNDALKSEPVKASLAKFNIDPNITEPKEFAEFLKGESAKWGGIIRTTGIKAE